MKISLIYHINSNYETLKNSLSSIFKQTNKDFEFILIDDHSNKQVRACIQKFDFSKLKKFIYINSNQKLGHSYSFNIGLENASGEYVYYLGSNVTLSKDFIKKVNALVTKHNNSNFIILNSKKSSDSLVTTYKNVDKDLFKVIKPSIKDKIFNTSFLKENKITFQNFQYYPIIYLYKILNKMTSCISVSEKLVSFFPNKKYTYNLYDAFEQADYLMAHSDKCNFLGSQELKDIYEFVIIYSILYSFLLKIDETYWTSKIFKTPVQMNKAISYCNEWLKSNIPNWRKNPILLNNTLSLNKTVYEYLKNFKFKTLYVHRKIR